MAEKVHYIVSTMDLFWMISILKMRFPCNDTSDVVSNKKKNCEEIESAKKIQKAKIWIEIKSGLIFFFFLSDQKMDTNTAKRLRIDLWIKYLTLAYPFKVLSRTELFWGFLESRVRLSMIKRIILKNFLIFSLLLTSCSIRRHLLHFFVVS